MDNKFRIIDANINRAAEGIRVIEDWLRFNLNNKEAASSARNIRHSIRKELDDKRYIFARDSVNDVGHEISIETNIDTRCEEHSIITANMKRAQESMRVIEEVYKIDGNMKYARRAEKIRFEIYQIEKRIEELCLRIIPQGIYCITAEKYSKGRKNCDVVLEMAKAGVKIIQYREKDKSIKEKYMECVEIRKITRDYNMKFIVNDHIDIAMLVDADGIHMGQDDLDIKSIRKIVGDKIIGYSTHSPEQAQKAVADGADYIGVGPIFRTFTKVNVCEPVGYEYLEYVSANIKIPFVAIGGIKENNLAEIVRRGAERICLVTDITEAENIKEKIERLNNIIKENKLCVK